MLMKSKHETTLSDVMKSPQKSLIGKNDYDDIENQNVLVWRNFPPSPNLIPTFLEMIRKHGPLLQKSK